MSEHKQHATALDWDGWTEMTDDGFIGLVGPFFWRRDGEQLRLRFPTADKHRNRRGVLQGGALMTFADRALGAAAREGRATEVSATMHLDVHFLAAVQIGEVVEAAPVVTRVTGKTVFLRADLTVGTRVVGMATGIWKRLGHLPGSGTAEAKGA